MILQICFIHYLMNKSSCILHACSISSTPRKFAYYAFNDGFGVVDASGEAVWDATGGRAVTETNPELLDVGRTMLQTTYVDIGRR